MQIPSNIPGYYLATIVKYVAITWLLQQEFYHGITTWLGILPRICNSSFEFKQFMNELKEIGFLFTLKELFDIVLALLQGLVGVCTGRGF